MKGQREKAVVGLADGRLVHEWCENICVRDDGSVSPYLKTDHPLEHVGSGRHQEYGFVSDALFSSVAFSFVTLLKKELSMDWRGAAPISPEDEVGAVVADAVSSGAARTPCGLGPMSKSQ